MAMAALGHNCIVREVELRNKPKALLSVSPKATVPVLLLPNETVVDESLDIVRWAIRHTAHNTSWREQELDDVLVKNNDGPFKHHLDRYKYSDRYPEDEDDHFALCGDFLAKLESVLIEANDGTVFLRAPSLSLVDIAIFPFVRQFYFVNPKKFASLKLPKLSAWLNYLLESAEFNCVMQKRAPWQENDTNHPIQLLDD